jgi:hypothetical protein
MSVSFLVRISVHGTMMDWNRAMMDWNRAMMEWSIYACTATGESEQVSVALIFWTYIRDVLGSSLGPDTGYSG